MKKLGLGMMRLPLLNREEPQSIDPEQVCQMVDTCISRGFVYFDTAYMYHGYRSENIVKQALVDRHERSSFLLASKLPTMYLKEKGDRERIFKEQLEKCGVDYFDYYLLHSLNTRLYEVAQKLDCFGFVSKLKQEGKVRHMGFSFHDTADVLERILTDHPEVDFVQLQINYLDWESEEIQSRRCYEVCVRHNKPVIVMEPVKGGTLASLPERAAKLLSDAAPERSAASWAIRYAASLEQVFMVLSGMSNMEQLNDNLNTMDAFRPLNAEEHALLKRAVKLIDEDIAVSCTACRYCVDGCPKKIEIPKYFALYNQVQQCPEREDRGEKAQYDALAATYGKPSDCVECGQCQRICPQHIRIIDALAKVAQCFER